MAASLQFTKDVWDGYLAYDVGHVFLVILFYTR